MFLVVGLGNPGSQYATTFHNMGFMTLEIVAQQCGVKFKTKECKAETSELFVHGEKVILARPQTFMNLSGDSVRELIGKYKIPLDHLLVVFDDIDLERGFLRLRASGSGGTHNGMRNIVENLGSTEFKRVRIGIGHPPTKEFPLADYVLSNIPKQDQSLMLTTLTQGAQACIDFFNGQAFDHIMQKYNGNTSV